MSLQMVSVGDTIPISGLSSTVVAGTLYNYGRTSGGNATAASATGGFGFGWWGIVQTDIIGTSAALTTIDGRPILDEDLTGLSIAGVNKGTGKGDLRVTGVHEIAIASGIACGGTIAAGVPVYASGVNCVAGPCVGGIGASDTTSLGMIQSRTGFNQYGWNGGLSLVGHAWRAPFLDMRAASNTRLSWVVETKLLGMPYGGIF